jgi:hypothetical protein
MDETAADDFRERNMFISGGILPVVVVLAVVVKVVFIVVFIVVVLLMPAPLVAVAVMSECE